MSRLNGSLDANVLLRLLTKDVSHQYDSAKKLINSGSEFAVADTAIIETVYALNEYYRIPRSLIKEMLLALMTNKSLRINANVFEEALTLYAKLPALSIEDCYLVIQAKQYAASPLWTFDKKLAKQTSGLAREIN